MVSCLHGKESGTWEGSDCYSACKHSECLVIPLLCHRLQVGDFAILLRAGFDRWSAACMQLSTALVGVLGACFALCAQSPHGAGKMGPVLSIHTHNHTSYC